jgi:hypothetical protein
MSWEPGKLFRSKRIGTYPTSLLRNPYKITMALLRRLYGEEDATKFMESWVPLIYIISKTYTIFN